MKNIVRIILAAALAVFMITSLCSCSLLLGDVGDFWATIEGTDADSDSASGGNNSSSAGDSGIRVDDNLDYTDLANLVSEKAMRFNVKVKATAYDSGYFGSLFPSSAMQGSGVIYKADDNYYYILTNNHVVVQEEDKSRYKYEVEDLYGNVYEAQLLCNDPAYDLAVLKFARPNDVQLGVALINETVPKKNATVISLGAPGGQYNFTSWGELLYYTDVSGVEGDSTTAINFDVYVHSCPLNSGSSGGALLNTKLELIGINYAAGDESGDWYNQGFAIPASRIVDFLIANEVR